MIARYLIEIKIVIDHIASFRPTVDVEDIIFYTINGLPSTYNAFKIVIHTKLTPISLEDLYSLLINKEINIITKSTKKM